jgi:flagellar protein FlaG
VSDGGRGLHFSIDDKMNTPVILVKNRESGEVIRQIPNEVVIKVAHSIDDLKGMLHNQAV